MQLQTGHEDASCLMHTPSLQSVQLQLLVI